MRPFIVALLIAVQFFSAAPALAVIGHAIVVRASGDPLIIWDATDEVADIVHNKQGDQAASSRLEHDALTALSDKLAALNKTSHRITLRIVYKKTAAVNSEYGTPTLAGVEKYATIEVSGKDAFGNRDGWRKLAPASRVPAWVHYKVTGQLPPR